MATRKQIKYSKSKKYELITLKSGIRRYVKIENIRKRVNKVVENYWKAKLKDTWLGGDLLYHDSQLQEQKLQHKKWGHKIKVKYMGDGYSVIYYQN